MSNIMYDRHPILRKIWTAPKGSPLLSTQFPYPHLALQ